MAGEPVTTVIGNLTGDPELRFTPAGKAVANFTVASTPRTFNRDTQEWKDGEPMFIRCAVWDSYAENVAESLLKGQQVMVHGELYVRRYETTEGEKRDSWEMRVRDVGAVLRFATAKITRVRKDGTTSSRPAATSSSANSDPWGGNQAEEPPF